MRCPRSSDSAAAQPRRKPPPVASGCLLAAASRSLQPRGSEHSPGQRHLNPSPSGLEALVAPAERRVESGVMCSCSAPPPDPSLPVPPLFPLPLSRLSHAARQRRASTQAQPTALSREVGVPTEAGAKGAVRNWLDRG